MMRNAIKDIQDKKDHGQKITMLTAYDYQIASLADDSGIDMILVGDSLANVVMGLDSTKEVGMEEMLHHARAVTRAVKKAMVVADMPFGAYQTNTGQAATQAKRFIHEAGCDAVKIEWFDDCLAVLAAIIKEGIPVMGHVGLTPQTVEDLGGYKVQGREQESAEKIIEQARSLEYNGCFSLVLECIPQELGEIITNILHIPTISCGAGVFCDGQVLVTNDMLGLTIRHTPKFVKPYADLKDRIMEGMLAYRKEVEAGLFPDDAHSYHLEPQVKERLREKYPNDKGRLV